MPGLSSSISNSIYAKLFRLQLIIIDEISLVGSRSLNRINSRLQQVFKSKVPFGNIPVIVFGDLNQLRPVRDSYIFDPKDKQQPLENMSSTILLSHFKMFELNQIMRQKDDLQFAISF